MNSIVFVKKGGISSYMVGSNKVEILKVSRITRKKPPIIDLVKQDQAQTKPQDTAIFYLVILNSPEQQGDLQDYYKGQIPRVTLQTASGIDRQQQAVAEYVEE